MEPKYDLDLDAAIEWLKENKTFLEQGNTPPNIGDVPPAVAFVLGYDTAIFNLKNVTGPNPAETGIITFTYEQKEAIDD